MIKVLPEKTKFKSDSIFIKNLTLTSFFKKALFLMYAIFGNYLSKYSQTKEKKLRSNWDVWDTLTPFNWFNCLFPIKNYSGLVRNKWNKE